MIREKRLDMNMTQKQLARKLRVDKSYISKIENKQSKKHPTTGNSKVSLEVKVNLKWLKFNFKSKK